MKVKAIKVGYYNHRRYKEGEVFEMEDDHYAPKDSDGNPKIYAPGTHKEGQEMFCSWVEPVHGKPSVKSFEIEEDADKPAPKKRRSSLHQDI
jgi:hypothetical protein